MKQSDIKVGVTYLFVATDSEARKHLEGKPFTVERIENVWRKFRGKGRKKVKRFFNDDNVGARAEELERITLCDNCQKPETDQAVVKHGEENWCLDCMRLAGHCIECDVDIRQVVEDYFMYDDDRCPDCVHGAKKIDPKPDDDLPF